MKSVDDFKPSNKPIRLSEALLRAWADKAAQQENWPVDSDLWRALQPKREHPRILMIGTATDHDG